MEFKARVKAQLKTGVKDTFRKAPDRATVKARVKAQVKAFLKCILNCPPGFLLLGILTPSEHKIVPKSDGLSNILSRHGYF